MDHDKTVSFLHCPTRFWVGYASVHAVGLAAEGFDPTSRYAPLYSSLIPAVLFVLGGSIFVATCMTVIFLIWWSIRHFRSKAPVNLNARWPLGAGVACFMVQMGLTILVYGVVNEHGVGLVLHNSLIDFIWLFCFFGLPAACAEGLVRMERAWR